MLTKNIDFFCYMRKGTFKCSSYLKDYGISILKLYLQ